MEGLPREQRVEEPAQRGRRATRWSFTLNNYVVSEAGYPKLWDDARRDKRIKYFVCGEEKAPGTGTPHLQGYIEVESQVRIVTLLSWPLFAGTGVHFEESRGSAEQNKEYCLKSDTFGLVFGTPSPGQGARTDWHTVHALALRNAPVTDFLSEVPHLAYPNIHKIGSWKAAHDERKRSWKTRPVVFIGPPRSGKSTRCRLEAARLADQHGWNIYVKSDADKWWPDYRGQEIIIIDEMNGSFFTWNDLLRVFEENPHSVQFKGGSTEFLARVIFMSANDHPAFWYMLPRTKKYRPWDDSNAFRARLKEFGELRVFSKPHRIEGEVQYSVGESVDFDNEIVPVPDWVIEELDHNRENF